ncbi:hypothetical protein D3C86_2020550 [compost metagenome]
MALPPMTFDRMWAMPTASVGAPPAREMMECSPTSLAVCTRISGVMWKPQPEMTAAAASGVVPSSAAGAFMAK